MIFKESDWSIESNTVVSGSGTYEITGLALSNKSIVARSAEGQCTGFGNVIPTNYAVFVEATGGTISYDGDYKIHTFTNSGDFVVTGGAGGLIEITVIGGGGFGGSSFYVSELGSTGQHSGGGGGGGEWVRTSDYEVEVKSYPIVVGASAGINGSYAEDSIFNIDVVIAKGGQGGRDGVLNNYSTGGVGGSGGTGDERHSGTAGTNGITNGSGGNGGGVYPEYLIKYGSPPHTVGVNATLNGQGGSGAGHCHSSYLERGRGKEGIVTIKYLFK